MKNKLAHILVQIGNDYRDEISIGSRFYREIDIGKLAGRLGYAEAREEYTGVNAIVPLSRPVSGMKVRVDGRTFTNYAQFESGVVVAGHIARQTGLPHTTFVPNDSMIRNFSES